MIDSAVPTPAPPDAPPALPALRLDLRHAGHPRGETYELVRLRPAGFADPHVASRLDPRGGYRWVLRDAEGGVLASRGYSTLFEEWQSTVPDAPDETTAAYAESHVVPWLPGAELVIERRVRGEEFRVVHRLELPVKVDEPDLEQPPTAPTLRVLAGHGGAARLLFVAEGYAADEAEAYFARAAEGAALLLAAEPYAGLAERLEIAALFLPSRRSGIPALPDDPAVADTCFASSYGTLGMARYLVATDLHALGQAVEGIRWTTLVVLANAADYGGSGIFNSNACVAAHMSDEDYGYVLLHELGHSLGGLGDEYFGKPVTYTVDPDDLPWEPNVSALDDAGRVKWSERIDAGRPVPTPWRKDEFLRLMQLPTSSGEAPTGNTPAEVRARVAELLAAEPHRDGLGAFEGARYTDHGLYRPEVDCRMFSRTARRYCRLCAETIAATLAEGAPDLEPVREPGPAERGSSD